MAWIESHQELERHPKTLHLMSLMGWDLDRTIGRLQRFWWWAMNYASDGDLSKYSYEVLGNVIGLRPEESEKFVQSMIRAGWIDEVPYLRIHDWWDYFGRFLKTKYKNYPDKWKEIEGRYCVSRVVSSKGAPKGESETQLPNQTLPYQTEPKKQQHAYSPALQAAIEKVIDNGLDIYALLGKLRKESKVSDQIPDEVYLKVCERYLEEKVSVKNPWAWFIVVLKKESAQYFANKNIQEHKEYKNEPVILVELLKIV